MLLDFHPAPSISLVIKKIRDFGSSRDRLPGSRLGFLVSVGSARVQGVHSLFAQENCEKADTGWSCQRCCFLLDVCRRRDSVWFRAGQRRRSKVSGSNWKLPDRAAMCDATFDATAAATLDAVASSHLLGEERGLCLTARGF